MSVEEARALPSGGGSGGEVSQLGLLIRLSLLQSWRKFKAVRNQSRLLTSVIGAFMAGYAFLAFWLFYKGLKFIAVFPGLGEILLERLLYLLFAFLFMMLLFSNLVIGYTNLFRNRETSFLLSLPLPFKTVFQWKFIETSVLASWAFLFLIAPMLLAYGLNNDAAWHFYAVTLVMIFVFIVLPSVFGVYLSINLARYMDRKSFQVAAVGGAILFIVLAALWMQPEVVSEEIEDSRVLGLMDRLLMRTEFAQYPLLPSYWLSSGVMNWLEGALSAAGFFLMVLVANALFFTMVACTSMGGLFYDASSAVRSRGGIFGQWDWHRRRHRGGRPFPYATGLTEWVFRLVPWGRPDVKALLIKDVRVFWRDTTQWGQTLMLFGLLGVYIVNLRHFSNQLVNPFWLHLVSYLNLGACSLNLATLTTRFVYPQYSLEGKRMWIVGMAPLGMARLVRAKFWLASLASLVITLGLMVLSARMLKQPWDQTLYFGAVIVVMTFTLTALAVGLGALYPNFKEDNPSKIVSGFGGTLCLVLSFVYIVFSVVVLAYGSPWWQRDGSGTTETAAAILFFVTSVALGWVPYHLGVRRARAVEL